MGRNDAARAIYSNKIEEVHMDERIARLESDVAHIQTDIADVKIDIRELRGDMKAANDSIAALKTDVSTLRAEVKAGFDDVKKSLKLTNATTIAAMLVIAGTILGVIARAMKWI